MKLSPSVLAQIEAYLQAEGISGAVLFGSQAQGKATSESDYDIAVLPEKKLSVYHLGALYEGLSSILHGKVDITDLSHLQSELLFRDIQKDGVFLFGEPSLRQFFTKKRTFRRSLSELTRYARSFGYTAAL